MCSFRAEVHKGNTIPYAHKMSARKLALQLGTAYLRTYGTRHLSTMRKYLRGSQRPMARPSRARQRYYLAPKRVRRKGSRFSFRKERLKIGAGKTRTTSKKHQNTFIDGFKDSRQLYDADMTLITRGTDINNRERDALFYTGIHLIFHATNKTPYLGVLNIAFVHPKNTGVVFTTDFFRGYTTERARDFSTTNDGLINCYYPINTDVNNVLWHKRFHLGADADNTSSDETTRNISSTRTFRKFIPIKRQLTYDNDNSTTCNEKIWMVYWFDLPSNPLSATSQPSAFDFNCRTITYFRDIADS